MLEFIVAVDEDGWPRCLTWDKIWGGHEKYGKETKKKLQQMQTYITHFSNVVRGRGGIQSFIFYVDARWSSLAVYDAFDRAGFYCVLSVSAAAKPKQLWSWMKGKPPKSKKKKGVKKHKGMKEPLEKGEWRCLYLPSSGGLLVVLRAKKNTHLNLLTNWGTADTEVATHQRRKFPATSFQIVAPKIQGDYNKYKAGVDQFSRNLNAYYRRARFVSDGILFTQFFIHASVVVAWTLYRLATHQEVSQLDFRLGLLKAFAPVPPPRSIPEGATVLPFCWPQKVSGANKMCHCHSRCSTYCSRCDIWACSKCMLELHRRRPGDS